MTYSKILYLGTFIGIIICWIVFAAAFAFRKRYKKTATTKRNNKAMLGIAIEMSGFAVVWSFQRTESFLISDGGSILASLISAVAIIVAIFSIWLVISAIRTLGKQWAIEARITEDHKLIIHGPYAIVRNPIYSGMMGMLFATGLAVSFWWATLIGVLLFWFGTVIRVAVEEKLLREAFGEKFDRYAQTVPSIIPGLY